MLLYTILFLILNDKMYTSIFHVRHGDDWQATSIRALYIRDCESLCLSEAVGPFYLVSMPGEVKDPTQGVNV